MSTDQFHWEQRPVLVDDIQDYLRQAIYSGRWAPGTRLRQEQLAEELQVSRTPLREALRVLESEGLLTATKGRGMVVASADLAAQLDAFRIREVTDGLAARIAAEQIGERLRDQLEELIALQRGALDPFAEQTWISEDANFHAAILTATRNKYLLAQVPVVRMTTQVFGPALGFERADVELALVEHRRIADAIYAGDGDSAELWARAHVRVGIGAIHRAQRHLAG